MWTYVVGLHDVDGTNASLCGGKGASLGELARLEGIRVPDGFCVTTAAYGRVVDASPSIGRLLDRLSSLEAESRDLIRKVSGELRSAMEGTAVPDDVRDAITGALSRLGADEACAVRSSATAEDLPATSFAGQQDSYLNVVGTEAILEHIRRCWASLFTERAVIYRMRHGIDPHEVHLAVVVQKMVFPHAAGVLFTADPVTSNRTVAAVEAVLGLGDALLSGRVAADRYTVQDNRIVEKVLTATEPAITDARILELAHLGRRIEAHFGHPQDIEWCLDAGGFHFVQSRPITTVFPVPDVGDGGHHVFVSVGHQQMMTDAMKPLGLSVFQLTAGRPMYAAGGRLFVDVTKELASPVLRNGFLKGMAAADPLLEDALRTLLGRRDFLPTTASAEQPAGGPTAHPAVDDDPKVVEDLIEAFRASMAELQRTIHTKTGVELLDFVLADLQHLRASLAAPYSMGVIMAVVQASVWLNETMKEWLGERNAADTLSKSLPNNVTTEMGRELLEVADVIRPFPEVVDFLHRAKDEDFLDGMAHLHGGAASRDAIRTWLDKYGMRGAGEIDVTRPRWSERPTTLVPLILANVRNFEQGASRRLFEQGRIEASDKEQELLDRLRRLPDGGEKAREAERAIRRLRIFLGYREYPKYAIVSRYFVYKKALLQEAARLVRAGVIREVEDIGYLTLHELRDVVHTQAMDPTILRRRKEEHELHRKLTPPRVITSDGEVVTGAYRRAGLPAGAIAGLAVSSGVVEGRARVLFDMAEVNVEPGDILVTTFTDPSWTPLFVTLGGLVTEVGGLMTHGAVIAREVGLPAVVGVQEATRRIRDGQRVRVNGTEGYVEVLDEQ